MNSSLSQVASTGLLSMKIGVAKIGSSAPAGSRRDRLIELQSNNFNLGFHLVPVPGTLQNFSVGTVSGPKYCDPQQQQEAIEAATVGTGGISNFIYKCFMVCKSLAINMRTLNNYFINMLNQPIITQDFLISNMLNLEDCFEESIDYTGDDIYRDAKFWDETRAECQRRCQNFEGARSIHRQITPRVNHI